MVRFGIDEEGSTAVERKTRIRNESYEKISDSESRKNFRNDLNEIRMNTSSVETRIILGLFGIKKNYVSRSLALE